MSKIRKQELHASNALKQLMGEFTTNSLNCLLFSQLFQFIHAIMQELCNSLILIDHLVGLNFQAQERCLCNLVPASWTTGHDEISVLLKFFNVFHHKFPVHVFTGYSEVRYFPSYKIMNSWSLLFVLQVLISVIIYSLCYSSAVCNSSL